MNKIQFKNIGISTCQNGSVGRALESQSSSNLTKGNCLLLETIHYKVRNPEMPILPLFVLVKNLIH